MEPSGEYLSSDSGSENDYREIVEDYLRAVSIETDTAKIDDVFSFVCELYRTNPSSEFLMSAMADIKARKYALKQEREREEQARAIEYANRVAQIKNYRPEYFTPQNHEVLPVTVMKGINAILAQLEIELNSTSSETEQ